MRTTKADYKRLWGEKQKCEETIRDCSIMLANCVAYIVKVHGEETAKELLKINGGEDT